MHISDIEAGGDVKVTLYHGGGYPRPDYLRELAALLAFYRERYVGREGELERIASFVTETPSGYLLVQAPGGFGKSALLGQLVDRVLGQHWLVRPVLVCCFVRADGARNTTVSFLQSVNAQLLGHLGLAGGTPPGVTELRGQFSELWSEAIRRVSATDPLLLVVDGLDEMEDGPVSIADVLPSSLADHVHVVISSRLEPDARHAVTRDHPLRSAEVLDLQAFGEDAVRLLINRFGLDESQVSAGRILALTAGEPLFVRFVCEAIARRGPAELDRLERNPPQDAEEYFREQLERLSEAELGDVSWRVLGALVVASGGMTEGELAEVLEQPPRALRVALRPIRRYLVGDDRLAIFHKRLTDLVAGEFTAHELAELRDSMVAWCQRYEQQDWPAETPRYILDHCSEHYLTADPKLAVGLPSKAWLERHRRTSGAAAGFIRDVGVALDAADGDVLTEVRLCLIGANAISMASVVPEQALQVLVRTGAAAEARARAGLANGEVGRARALTEVAVGYAAIGDDAGKVEAITAAVEELAREEFKFGDFVPAFLGVTALAKGHVAILRQLLHVARSTDPAWGADRAACIGAAAAELRALGETTLGAEAIREAVEAFHADEEADSSVFAAIAVAAGDAGAPTHLGELEEDAVDVLERAGLAEGWARFGDPTRSAAMAERLADSVRPADPGEGHVKAIADAVRMLEHPSLQQVRRVLGAELARVYTGRTLQRWGPDAEVAAALAAVRDVAALAAIESMVDDENNDLYGAMAEAYAATGYGEDAVRCLRRMRLGDGSMIDASAQPIARALAAAGDIDHARQVADIAVYASATAAAMASVAAALLDAGDEPGAVETARHAIRTAESIEDQGDAAAALASLAAAIASAGDTSLSAATLDLAVAALEPVLPARGATGTTRPVISALAQQGRFDDALAIADGEYPDLIAIAQIAAGMADAGQTAGATALAERVVADAPASYDGVEALVAAASAFRQLGLDDRAGECLALVQVDDDDVAYRGHHLVRGLYDAGRTDDAAKAARAMAALPDVTPGVAANLFAAAGLADDAAVRAREALTQSDDDDWIGNDLGLTRRARLAELLPRDEAIGVLTDLRAAASDVNTPLWRSSVLTVIAGVLRPLDTALAAATLRDAFLTGWLGGRMAVMRAIVDGPLVELRADLPEQLARMIPEADAWWTDEGAV